MSLHTGSVSVDAVPALACCAPLVGRALTAEEATDLARVLKAIADPARLRLLSRVAAHAGGEAGGCAPNQPRGRTPPTVWPPLQGRGGAGRVSAHKAIRTRRGLCNRRRGF